MKSLKTPLRYPGGKSRACTKLATVFPDLSKFKEYREPFLGGGSVALYVTKMYPHLNVWVNDLYVPLINFWKELNSIPKELTMQQHEQVLMLTSHLPHVLAFIMIKVLFEKSSDEGTKNLTKSLKDFSGGGLKEFLRLASSDSQVWTDIIISNKKELKKGIEIFESELGNFKKLLTNIEKEEVLEILENVKDFVDSNWT